MISPEQSCAIGSESEQALSRCVACKYQLEIPTSGGGDSGDDVGGGGDDAAGGGDDGNNEKSHNKDH